MEILVTVGLISFIIYLRYYAELRTEWEKEMEQFREGIELFDNHHLDEAFYYFNEQLKAHPRSGLAYLYRARCYRAMGDTEAALKDLETGESYDGTIPDLHLEMGKIQFDRHDYPAALQTFNKAVFHSHQVMAEPYYWRGLTLEQLDRSADARQDQQKAEAIRQAIKGDKPGREYGRKAFFDRHMLLSALAVGVNSLLLLYVIKTTFVIHWPYLLAATSAALIGFIEPRKGWALAVLQVAVVWLGYQFFTTAPLSGGKRELELFGLYGSMILTFIGSFVGGVLKRATKR